MTDQRVVEDGHSSMNHVCTIEDHASSDLARLARGVRSLSRAFGEILEVRERILERAQGITSLLAFTNTDGSPALGADRGVVRFEVNEAYRNLSTALEALGTDLEAVNARHRESLQSALSAVVTFEETGGESSHDRLSKIEPPTKSAATSP